MHCELDDSFCRFYENISSEMSSILHLPNIPPKARPAAKDGMEPVRNEHVASFTTVRSKVT